MVRYYSVSEKRDMYNAYIRNFRNATISSRVYGELYPERRRPNPTTFLRLFRFVDEHGSFQNKRVRNLGEMANEINVLAQVNIDPGLAQRKIGMECNLSKSGVQKILKKHRYHDFKYKPVQKLHPDDAQRRLDFCRWFRATLRQDPNFCHKIIWSDESLFTNSGMFNRRNKHFYSTQNPHLVREVRPQVRFSVNVWCGLFGDILLGPVFIPNRLTGQMYVDFLQNEFEEMIDNLPLEAIRNINYFQQDGAGPHNARVVREFLDRRFPNAWIGTHGPVRWPPRSPCLNPLDYFLWGFVKNKIYDTPVHSEEHLRAKIREVFLSITPEMIRRATASMDRRTSLCIEHTGGHFEQYL